MSLSSIKRASLPVLGAIDEAVVRNVLAPPKAWRHPIEALEHPERMHVMQAMRAFYESAAREESFFTRSPHIEPQARRVRSYGKTGEALDLRWSSGFESLWSAEEATRRIQRLADERADASLRSALQACQEVDERLGLRVDPNAHPTNQVARARWFRHHDGLRPCAVVIHGYLGGHFALEERIWPIRALFDGGMDVVLTVLPMHGPRTPSGHRMRLPLFPAVDPREAIEGFRQLVHEHLSLFDYLLDGHVASLGVLGMSLGGYSAALLATLDARLKFGAFHMPLMSVADFALRSGRMVGTEVQQRDQAEALEGIYEVISPLARPSLLPPERVTVSAANADRITGPAHAHGLARHFGVQTVSFAGSHLAPLAARDAFTPLWSTLRDAGLWKEPGKPALPKLPRIRAAS